MAEESAAETVVDIDDGNEASQDQSRPGTARSSDPQPFSRQSSAKSVKSAKSVAWSVGQSSDKELIEEDDDAPKKKSCLSNIISGEKMGVLYIKIPILNTFSRNVGFS